MKGKTTDSLKPPLTKSPSEVGYWKLNEIPGSGECLRQKHLFFNFWSQTIWANYGKKSRVKMVEGSIKSMKSRKQNGSYSRCVKEEGGWKIGQKIRAYEMDGPRQILRNIFCAFVQSGTLKYHRQQGKFRSFLLS